MIEWHDMPDDELVAHKKAAEDWASQQETEYFKGVWQEVADEIEAVITERKNIRDLYS